VLLFFVKNSGGSSREIPPLPHADRPGTRKVPDGRSGRGSLASSHAGTRLPIAKYDPDSGRSPSAGNKKQEMPVRHLL